MCQLLPFEQLQKDNGSQGSWQHITEVRQASQAKFKEIGTTVGTLSLGKAQDVSLVLFGSCARKEWTTGSDVDWSLLIDGPTDVQHFGLAHSITAEFQKMKMQLPGATGTFGSLISSHELVHHIGGLEDSNPNLTRRMLLLLESTAAANTLVHDRVIRAILDRYFASDSSVSSQESGNPGVPRFLLNDMIRYWRTMAVDYAAKRYQQPNGKWALRNTKLRFSRKLIFASGLLTCFSSKLKLGPFSSPSGELDKDGKSNKSVLVNSFRKLFQLTPIDIFAQTMIDLKIAKKVWKNIFDAYNYFLGVMNDPGQRKKLSKLSFNTAKTDPLFKEIRDCSHQFQEGLNSLFFENDQIKPLTLKYGLF